MKREIALLSCVMLMLSCEQASTSLDEGPSEGSATTDAGDGDAGDGDPGDGDGDGDAGDGDGDGDTGDGDGDTGDGDGDTGDGDGDTGDGDGDPDDGGLKFDLLEIDSPGPIEEVPPWLVSMSQLELGGNVHLIHIDIETAVSEPVCELIDAMTQLPFTNKGPSLTFTRDDRLIASFSSRISEITLPDCQVVEIGDIGYTSVNGILPDEGNELYGISSGSDVLLHIDTGTGMGVSLGALGQNWNTNGGTWVEATQDILGLSGIDDGLYDIDQGNGSAALLATLDIDFSTIGMEYHPLTEQVYACTGDGHLYRIEDDYSITDIGDMGLYGSCTNLGAPWSTNVVLPQL